MSTTPGTMFKIFKSNPLQTEFKTLQEVQDYLRRLPFVDFGGCGVSSLAMYRWLKKNKKTNSRTCFYLLSDIFYIHYNNKEYLKKNKNNKQPTAPGHMVLYNKGVYFDCHGKCDLNYFKYRLKTDNEQFIIDTLNNVPSWNETFPRKRLIKKIAKRLKIDLSDVLVNDN